MFDDILHFLARHLETPDRDVLALAGAVAAPTLVYRRRMALKIRRAVLAGSVLPRDFDRTSIIERKQVEQVRNYVSGDDRVVGLFPRPFESKPASWMGNDIGSAGFA